MADVTWHSLGVQQGFISAMSYVDFHGVFGTAHTTADVGGDVVNEFELSLKYISDLGDWYVPVDDLYNIYSDLYGEVRLNKSDIVECSSFMFLGRLGEQLAISLLYAEYYNKSLFLTDRLNDYFLGGMDDMATWTQLSWNKALYMLENGVE
jgi:glycosylphosphatidylinositol phospholipase D